MTIKEKVKKMNEMLAEVSNLAKEINKEISTERTDTTDMLSIYIDDIKSSLSQYWVDSDGNVRNGTTEYRPDDFNPYCNYISDTYAKTAASMKKFTDILLAFKWCYDRCYEPDWTSAENKYYIYYNVEKSKYDIDSVYNMVECTVYFRSIQIARICANYLTRIDPEGELIK